MVRLALASLLMSAVVVVTQGLTLKEVRDNLKETRMMVMAKLAEAQRELRAAFRVHNTYLRQTIRAQDLTASSSEIWNNHSALYDYLDAADPPIYQDILDKYFSSAGDLYEFLESRISPWYDTFDEQKIYDYRFYALVDSYDVLYNTVDERNDKLYSEADDRFEALYEILELRNEDLDALDEDRYDSSKGYAEAVARAELTLSRHIDRAAEASNEALERQLQVAEERELRKALAQNVLAEGAIKQGLAAATVDKEEPEVVPAGLSAGASFGVAIGAIAGCAALVVSLSIWRKNRQVEAASEVAVVERKV